MPESRTMKNVIHFFEHLLVALRTVMYSKMMAKQVLSELNKC